MKKVAIQGTDASFHDIAARRYFGSEIKTMHYDLPFKNVFEALKHDADYAVCAIENSLYGSINEVYDLLLSTHASIIGEVYLRIEQALIGLPGSSIDALTEVHSHPVALAQCELFLDTEIPHVARFENHDTAASVALVKKMNDPTKAAIASKQAAELYGLSVLKNKIETNHQNYTRFVILQLGNSKPSPDANKTSLVLKTHGDTKPGALYRALGAFEKRNLNLTLLHSRPLVGKAWHYMFYIDVLGGATDSTLNDAVSELESYGCEIKLLGSYKAGMTV